MLGRYCISLSHEHRHSIRVDRLTLGEAQEGQLFGLKIEHLNLRKIVNKINSHSLYIETKFGALPNYTNKFNLILLRHRVQLSFHFFLLMTE